MTAVEHPAVTDGRHLRQAGSWGRRDETDTLEDPNPLRLVVADGDVLRGHRASNLSRSVIVWVARNHPDQPFGSGTTSAATTHTVAASNDVSAGASWSA